MRELKHAPRTNESGFTITEVIVAAVIAIVAVIGMAYSFGLGRAFINRFEMGRAALAAAQQRMEILQATPATSDAFSPDSVHLRPFNQGDQQVGTESWVVTWYNDPSTAAVNDLKRVDVSVSWMEGSVSDSVRISRLFLPY